jgi:hypothetical protein
MLQLNIPEENLTQYKALKINAYDRLFIYTKDKKESIILFKISN